MERAEQRDAAQQVIRMRELLCEDPLAIGGEFALEPPERHARRRAAAAAGRQRRIGLGEGARDALSSCGVPASSSRPDTGSAARRPRADRRGGIVGPVDVVVEVGILLVGEVDEARERHDMARLQRWTCAAITSSLRAAAALRKCAFDRPPFQAA
jgi:hypothetical protein